MSPAAFRAVITCAPLDELEVELEELLEEELLEEELLLEELLDELFEALDEELELGPVVRSDAPQAVRKITKKPHTNLD